MRGLRRVSIIIGKIIFILGSLWLASTMLQKNIFTQHKAVLAQSDIRHINCNPSNGSGGLAAGTYDTTIAGQPAIVIVSQNYNPATPTYLSFYLHGDGGGYNFYSSNGSNLNNFVDDQGWIYVAPQSFTDPGSGITRWWAAGVGSDNSGIEANAQLLEDVIEDMFANYNICQNVLLGYSASGGSWFYDAYFYPTRGAEYPAFININCGSSGIDTNWEFFSFYDDLLAVLTNGDAMNRTQLHYTVGTDDFLYDEVQDAAPFYESLGFDVTTDILQDVAHCAFDISDKTIAYWTDVDNKINLLSAPLNDEVYLPILRFD